MYVHTCILHKYNMHISSHTCIYMYMYIYMLHTPYIYHTFIIHLSYIYHTFIIHMSYISHTYICHTYVILISCIYHTYYIFMCQTHIIHTSCIYIYIYACVHISLATEDNSDGRRPGSECDFKSWSRCWPDGASGLKVSMSVAELTCNSKVFHPHVHVVPRYKDAESHGR